jgi:hypothetical protein
VRKVVFAFFPFTTNYGDFNVADFIDKLEGFAPSISMPGGPAAIPKRRILLDANAGDVVIGGNGSGGDIRVVDHENAPKIRLDALGTEANLTAMLASTVPISILGNGSIKAGSAGTNGKVSLCDGEGRELATLSAATQDLALRAPNGNSTVALRASENNVAGLWMGSNGHNGMVLLRDGTGQNRAMLGGAQGRLQLSGRNGAPTVDLYSSNSNDRAGLMAGDNGMHGFVRCRNASGTSRFEVDAMDGEVKVQNANGDATVILRGSDGSARLGGRGVNGDVMVFSENVDERSSENASIWLQGSSGDIILRNADCAEEFDVRVQDEVEPGAVLVLDPDGRLAVSNKPYDTCVAGVISGADGVRPGIVLGRTPGVRDRLPVGLAGKVLTTSPRAGYAMAATDRERAFGAVLGKAMARISSGSGRIPVLVALQ